ncbi:FAD-dependent oxidoreductase [Pseudalkalibacillus hwajinpoensis]|uniref:NAD(P)/FAD-dependent oxidoreductase n=1 Tax=Guptibacillus hwajinpoensis TaxID=208199 RepID=UPI00325AA88F
MRTVDIAIVGGGIAGILAARKLRENGRDVLVLDKSKSVGGRLATRRIDAGRADHGAQFFTVRTEMFQQLVDEWEEHGWVTRWFGEKHARYKSTAGMNQLVKHLAKEVPVQLTSKVEHVGREGDMYIIVSEEGESVKASTVLLTLPAPQALQLLETSNVQVADHARKSLSHITFDPAIVGLVTLDGEASTGLPPSGHQDEGLPEGIERIVDSYAKGISSERIMSIYANTELSKALYSEEDDVILSKMMKRVSHLINADRVQSSQLKRWRYAQASNVHHAPTLRVSDQESIWVAGDAFLRSDDKSGRTRIESAVLSGLAAASNILDLSR